MDRRLQEPKGWKGGPMNIWSTSSKSHWETPQTCDYIWSNSIRNQVKLGTCGNTTVWENSWWWDEINVNKLSQQTKSYKSFHSNRYYKKDLKYWKTEESNNLTILKFWFFQTASIHNLPVTERKEEKKNHTAVAWNRILQQLITIWCGPGEALDLSPGTLFPGEQSSWNLTCLGNFVAQERVGNHPLESHSEKSNDSSLSSQKGCSHGPKVQEKAPLYDQKVRGQIMLKVDATSTHWSSEEVCTS